MENKLQNIKFRVYSESHSKAIQEKLFELDESIHWLISKRKVANTDRDFLYLGSCGVISYGNLLDPFNKNSSTLCTLDDLYKMQAEPNPQSELMTKLESIQKQLDNVKEEISKLNK